MKANQRRQSVLRDRRGFLTIDFLFAITMAAALIMIMFAFSTTLSMLEIAQYIAFSTARAHAPAHLNQEKQVQLATDRFEAYQDPNRFPALAPLLKNGWFTLEPKSLEIRGGGKATAGSGEATFNEEYGYQQNAMPMTGVRFRFEAKILKMNLPFLGRVTSEEDFGTFITGFLIREPTTEECKKQMRPEARFKAILDQDSRFNAIYSGGVPSSKKTAYFEMEDTGC